MNKDPYNILGVARDATDEQIKAAYRDLARRNHPDNFTDPALAANAEERMKEINEAYDAIRRARAAKEGGSAGAFSNAYADQLSDARYAIRSGKFDQASAILQAIPPADRGGEWHFLQGCILVQKGWYFDAQKYLETACYMDPNNAEYREFRDNIRSAASTHGRGYKANAPGGRSDLCDLCMSLACLDCMCDCCGGDFIRCC